MSTEHLKRAPVICRGSLRTMEEGTKRQEVCLRHSKGSWGSARRDGVFGFKMDLKFLGT